jgi:hypothetical protein
VVEAAMPRRIVKMRKTAGVKERRPEYVVDQQSLHYTAWGRAKSSSLYPAIVPLSFHNTCNKISDSVATSMRNIPSKRLCMGSMIVIRTGSKYDNLANSVHRTPWFFKKNCLSISLVRLFH